MGNSVQIQCQESTLVLGLEKEKDCSLSHMVGLQLQVPLDVTIKPEEESDILHVMYSPKGSKVTVYESCVNGTCCCRYYIGEIPCQLKPCRFAAIITSYPEWANKYSDLLWVLHSLLSYCVGLGGYVSATG